MPTPTVPDPAFHAWRRRGEAFAFAGRRVFVQRAGADAARTLLCIHGFPTASWDWHALWPALTDTFGLVLAPDLLGFGWSDKPAGHAYSVREQADLCETLLRAHGVARVHLLAHDLGDSVAQELLARDLERRAARDESLQIVSAVLLNGGLFPEMHRPRLVQRLLLSPLGPLLAHAYTRRAFGRSFAAVFGARTRPSEAELDAFWALIAHADGQRRMHRLIRYIPERRQQRERWVGALQRTPVPLRLIVGMDDPVSGAHMAQRYRELVPAADVVALPEIGHYPQVEAPAAVLAALRDFHARVA